MNVVSTSVNLDVTDACLVGVLTLSMLLGAWRGLVYEVLSVLGWAASFYAAQWFAPQVANSLALPSAPEPVRHAAAFVLVFVMAVFSAGLLAFALKKCVEAVGLRPVDRVMGALFGGLRGIILLLAITVVMDTTGLKNSPWWQQSKTATLLASTLAGLKPALPEQFVKYLN